MREEPLGGVNPPTTTTTVWGGLTPPKLFKSINQRVLGGVNPPQPKDWTSTTVGGTRKSIEIDENPCKSMKVLEIHENPRKTMTIYENE